MPVIKIPIQDFSDIVPFRQYIFRGCRYCGHNNPPVEYRDDDYNNKCPKCSGVMVSSIRMIPFGKVMIFEEEELGTSSISCGV